MVAISQNRAAEGSLHLSMDQASVIHTVYWMRQEACVSSVSVMESSDGASRVGNPEEDRSEAVLFVLDAVRDGAGL
jgi:hypothetical protein